MKFGISKNVKSRDVRLCTEELFNRAVDSPFVAKICAEIEDAFEACRRGEMQPADFDTLKGQLKKQLPVFTPHAIFQNGRRLNSEAVPSGMSMYDIDHLNDPLGYFADHIEHRIAPLRILLAHITPSMQGLRLFFAIPCGKSLAGAQEWMSQMLGDPCYDHSVKDYARSSFVVPRHYILYLDAPRLFAEEDMLPFPEETSPPGLPPAAEQAAIPENVQPAPQETENVQPQAEENPGDERLLFKGIPYSEIIGEWFELTGGTPVEGERNDRLHQLAVHLRYITNDDENLLLRLIPSFGLNRDELRQLIHSACTAKRYTLPKIMREAIARAEGKTASESTADDEPPAMPERLPPLIELLVSRTPDVYKPAVAHAVFPSLAAHLHRVRFEYIDGVEHEATLMNVLMAGTGAGKDCITRPIDYIMDDIRRRDEENLLREEQWKNEVNSKGANKDKQKRPDGLIIQEIDADMTNPAFVMRMAEADGHFLYTKMNEIEQFNALKGSHGGRQQFMIMCLAFDPGNRYGQTRVGTQSVTKKVQIRFNWNAVTTILKGKRYFRDVLTDGPVSRINFCTIPEREIGADMPEYGKYTQEFADRLKPYILHLTSASGLVEAPQARQLAIKLKDANAAFARQSQSRVFENLSFRANVIAWLKACVLYIAHGCKWDDTMEDFVSWSLRYDLWCKMMFFGNEIERASEDTTACKKIRVQNLLHLLPETFTFKEVEELRRQNGMSVQGTRNMLNQWKFRGYILQLTTYTFKKQPLETTEKNLYDLWN